MLLHDLRYAVRTLLRNPGFTLVAVACLSLGIGVNTTIFSVVDGVILNPYPYPSADRIVVLHSTNETLRVGRTGPSYLDFKDWREAATTMEAMAAFTSRSLTIVDGSGEPERFPGATVSAGLFQILGEKPVIGRDFRADDDRPGAELVVMLSDQVWRARYGSDPAVVGRPITVNGRPHTIIGVMPPRFAFPERHKLWVPLAAYGEATPREQRTIQVFARMKPGVTIDQVRTEMASIAGGLAVAYPDANENWTAGARPLRDWLLPEEIKLMLLTMMGAVTLVLLIACANVANLLLARASIRQREITLRVALGAGRWRIVRQLLTEAVMIGLISAPIGIALAFLGLRLLGMGMPQDGVPYFIRWSIDSRALIYTIGVSMLTGIVFGLAPAVQAARGNLQETLKEGGRGSAGASRAWLRSSLVVAEVALSLVLLIGASLFVRSFFNLQHAVLGFDTTPLMTARFYLPGVQYDAADPKARRIDDIIGRVETLPGVEAAFASNWVPMSGGGGGGRVTVEGSTVERGKEPSVGVAAVTPHMRQTLGVALERGRDFTDTEGATRSPVALINASMARQLWPDQDPLGRRFKMSDGRYPDWFTVIGVVADFRHFVPQGDTPTEPNAYVPLPYDPTLNTGLTIRTAGTPTAISAAVREQIRASDPTLPVFEMLAMEEHRERSFWQQRLFGMMFAVFGGIALLLASIGVYGVLSYAVSQRTQEIGVRMALGAGRRDVLKLIVGHGLKLAGIGVIFGLAGASQAAKVVATQLYKVESSDPLSFAGVALFLTLVAFIASYLPARRAMAVDPIVALRND